jgi:predicted AAA+ superfamily ATPase
MAAVPPHDYRARLVDRLLDEYATQLPALMISGARATGKTTTVARRAASIVRLDVDAQAAAFRADPDAALRGLDEPVLLDEWQAVPGVLGAVRRAVEAQPTPNRYLLTGSVHAELDNAVWPATGRIVRLSMYPMTVRERAGRANGPTFFDKLVRGEELTVPAAAPDLQGYVDLAVHSGFPTAALLLTGGPRRAWLESYLENLLTRDVEALEASTTRRRDTVRLRRYFEAYALSSAGAADHKKIYDAAGINRITANAYEQLLGDLFVVDQLAAWETNRLKRVVKTPKRYVVEPALIAAALRLDTRGILSDGDLLGRLLDTFVAAQLRPEVMLSDSRPRLFHLRTQSGREEIDIVAELGGQRAIGIEVKANAAPDPSAARHLRWMRDKLGDRFVVGVVLHTGPTTYGLDDKIVAAPIATTWG